MLTKSHEEENEQQPSFFLRPPKICSRLKIKLFYGNLSRRAVPKNMLTQCKCMTNCAKIIAICKE